MNSANDLKDSTFKSYIDESEFENISLKDFIKTRLLDGETLVHEAPKVLLYAPLSDRKQGILGVLSVTTFKLSFVSPNDEIDKPNEYYQYNNLLKKNEVCLSCVDTIYQLGDKSKKKLLPGQNVTGKVKELLIVCKNMRSLWFSFKQADREHGRNIVNALLHHAYPKRHQLLFAYDFKEPNRLINKEARLYVTSEDWRKELERTKCINWHISDVNKDFQVTPHLPQYVVVPRSIMNKHIQEASRHFRNEGFPVWVWGTNTAALVRMPDLLATITDKSQENRLLGSIHRSHPMELEPKIFELSKDFPSPKDVQNSYIKLRNLCTPDSIRLFRAQDFKFYSSLDNSKWLHYVSLCLGKAAEGAHYIYEKETTVVLQEDKGQDMNCVISSLIQILLDSHWRTRKGFQSLIQKDWVAMGHPFAFRLGHLLNTDIEPSYLFLMFLDCTWQLLQQFPFAFQFTETYLTTVWDSTHITVFDTFLFNSEHDRFMASTGNNRLLLRSVWDWNEQFSDDGIVLFKNPLFDKQFKSRLEPKVGISSLEMWKQCYFRWLPDLEIRNGGKPQIDISNRFLVEELQLYKYKLQNCEYNGIINKTKDDYLKVLTKVNSFYPFSCGSSAIAGALQVNSDLLAGDETQSILNMTND